MAFPERFLDELTERNDIVDVVSQYVRLTKKSGANLFGLYPFLRIAFASDSHESGAKPRPKRVTIAGEMARRRT